MTAPDTGMTRYSYDDAGNTLTDTDPRGNTTTYAYDGASRLISVTGPDPDGPGPQGPSITTYGYDANGNRSSMVEPRGNVAGCGCAAQYTTTYGYDRANRGTTETDPLGNVTSRSYDAVGNTLMKTTARGYTTRYSYDGLNRVLTVTAPTGGPTGAVTAYTYDLAGNLTARTDPKNHTASYSYDADNRRTTVTTPLGRAWTSSYDPGGNVVTTTDANGNASPAAGDGVTGYTYDRAGHLTGIDYADGATRDVGYGYDAAGNRVSMTDGQGTQTRTYDSVKRLTGVTRGTDTFSYGYDLAGNLTRRTYPGGAATDYAYDAANRMSSLTSGSATTSYGYDVAGNLLQTVFPASNGYTENRTYDRAGRLTAVKTTRPSAATATEPEIPDGLPERTNMTGSVTDVDEDPDVPDTLWMNATTASVNPSARVTLATPTGSVTGTQTFKARVRKHGGSATPTARIDVYENGVLRATGTNQNITSTTGQTITQTFDTAALTDTSGAGVEARFVGTAVGSGTKVASIDLGAVRWTATYIAAPQTLNDFTYGLDEVGNPTVITTPTISTLYEYDTRDRLTRICGPRINCIQNPPPPPSGPSGPLIPGGPVDSTEWTYDDVGNRTSRTVNGFLTTYSYDADDELTQRATGDVTTSHSYDTNGNEIGAGTVVFAYDQANRLVSAQTGSTNETYSYDGDGNRIQAGSTTGLWDVNQPVPQLALERDSGGSLLRRYTYGIARTSMDTPGGAFYYHADRLGSVSNLTSANGALKSTYDYEPYGTIKTSTSASGAPTNPMLFAGEQQDGTGLYYLRARQYDPALGRFLGIDPQDAELGNPTVSAYAYAADQPTVLTDPSGERNVPASTHFRALTAATVSPVPWACPSSHTALVYPFDSGNQSFAFLGAVAPSRVGNRTVDRGSATGSYYYVRAFGRAYVTRFASAESYNACIQFGLGWDFSSLSSRDTVDLTLKYNWRDVRTGKLSSEQFFCDHDPAYIRHRIRHDGGPGCRGRWAFDLSQPHYYLPKGSVSSFDNVDFYGIDIDVFEPGRVTVIGALYRAGYGPLWAVPSLIQPRFDRELRCELAQGVAARCSTR